MQTNRPRPIDNRPDFRKPKKITLCITEHDFDILNSIRDKHHKSISGLVRDAIVFYSAYYTNRDIFSK